MTFGEWAAAVGLLTPLALGLGALAKDIITRKDNRAEGPKTEPVMQGMVVAPDYAGELIGELRADLRKANEALAVAEAKVKACEQIHQR